MGCASSTPMVQTSGSEMLKAASHVATDATKSAEDAVEGIKDSIAKTLETAKDSVATTVEGVKHEVENVVKEKSEMLEDAKNSLLEKLHLKQTEENEGNKENSNTSLDNIAETETETDEVKTQLKENLKSTNTEKDAPAPALSLAEQTIEAKGIRECAVVATDTETDSLKTSTPEPEIEQALAKSLDNQENEDDNPPTPKPTLAELENLTAEFISQRQQPTDDTTMVNDIAMINDPLMSVMHENIKSLDSNNTMSLNAVDNTTKDNEPTAPPMANNNDIKSTNVQ